MGKYNDEMDDIIENQLSSNELSFLFHIANELAEANRLKRIELSNFNITIDKKYNVNSIRPDIQEELEDQA